ncbi:MAG TPA: hypothetical protein VNH44_16505 [Micropepsaceae bacterium]|nr:hypothetical protein [Micropepsaceae bacterium]
MSGFDREIAEFYHHIADRLDALPSELPHGTQISERFAAFLANAVREIREDANLVAVRVREFDPNRRWDMFKDEARQACEAQRRFTRN